jgi:hypothetical protein
MGLAVVTVASGGLPVIDVTATTPKLGVPVTEAANGLGIAVTKVTLPKGGLPVTFVAADFGLWPPPVAPFTPTVLATAQNATLSNGGLTVTHTNALQGGGRSTAYKSSGKHYFEVRIGQRSGDHDAITLQPSSATYGGAFVGNGNITCFLNLVRWPGNLASGGGLTSQSTGPINLNDIVCCAVDLDNKKAWFRANSGLWNGDVHDPSSGLGAALGFASGAFAPMITFDLGAINDTHTVNFGQSAFAFAPPAGFAPGWAA